MLELKKVKLLMKIQSDLKPLFKKLKKFPSRKQIHAMNIQYPNSWFVQQDLDLVIKIKNLIAEMYLEFYNLDEDPRKLNKDSNGNYIWSYEMGRAFDDQSDRFIIKHLKKYVDIMYCISEKSGKMFEQPYFTLHEDEATIDLSDGRMI